MKKKNANMVFPVTNITKINAAGNASYRFLYVFSIFLIAKNIKIPFNTPITKISIKNFIPLNILNAQYPVMFQQN